MVIRLIETLVVVFLLVLIGTEFFYPLLTNKKLFPSFRKNDCGNKDKDVKEKPADAGELGKKIEDAKEKVKQVKDTQEEVREYYENAQSMKTESDGLLK